MIGGALTSSLAAVVSLVVLVSSLFAVYLVTKSKRVEASITVLGQLVDSLTKGNADLRATLAHQEHQHQQDRKADMAVCDAALAQERSERRIEHLACQKEVSLLQGKVDVLTTNLAEVIASAVIGAVALRQSESRAAVLEDREARNQGEQHP